MQEEEIAILEGGRKPEGGGATACAAALQFVDVGREDERCWKFGI
jgi:hypothetical protein